MKRRRLIPLVGLGLLIAGVSVFFASGPEQPDCVGSLGGQPLPCDNPAAVSADEFEAERGEAPPAERDAATTAAAIVLTALGSAAIAVALVPALGSRLRRRSQGTPDSLTSAEEDQPEDDLPLPPPAPEEPAAERYVAPPAPASTPPPTPDLIGAMEHAAAEAPVPKDNQPTAGWYVNPDGPGSRYHDGERWTDSYHPLLPDAHQESPTKIILWGLALGFGATGAVGALAIPLIAFYFPLGFGLAGLLLCLAAATAPRGEAPWWAVLAVLASIAALVAGGSAYSEFEDVSDRADDALRDLDFGR